MDMAALPDPRAARHDAGRGPARLPGTVPVPLVAVVGADLSARLEAGFGEDLTTVAVHVGAAADRLCRLLGTDAFAHGDTVVLAGDAPPPRSPSGLRVIAHEVAHVLQQRRGVVGPGSSAGGYRRWEAAAERDAVRVVRGERAAEVPRRRPGRTAGAEATVVQRHGSWEHRLLGDAPPGTLAKLATGSPDRATLLQSWKDLLSIWAQDPASVTAQQIEDKLPTVRVITMPISGLVVTYGELNALPDFFANPTSIMELPAATLLPILQTLRQEGYNAVDRLLSALSVPTSFRGAVVSPYLARISSQVYAWRETVGVEPLTRALGVLGSDHYEAVLARNACHFAPFTWRRFQAFNTLARQYAQAAHDDPPNAARNTQLAWQYAGYADHFLQDSFAAGHLVNKTLVMQWFIEWVSGTVVPVDNWDAIKAFTTAAQPGLAGTPLYDLTQVLASTDPQTVEEYPTYAQRLAAAGLTGASDATYQNYLAFLGSMAAQLASGLVHDHFNHSSVYVASTAQPNAFQLWGDDTLLNGAAGADATQKAVLRSQQAIEDLIENGATTFTQQSLLDQLPTRVSSTADAALAPVADWARGLEQQCKNDIFGYLRTAVAWGLSPRINRVSQDTAGRPAASEVWRQRLSSWPAWDNGLGRNVSVLVAGESVYATTPGYLYRLVKATGAEPEGYHNLHADGYDYSDVRLAGDHGRVYCGIDGYLPAISTAALSYTTWYAKLGGSGSTYAVNPIMVEIQDEVASAEDPADRAWPYVGHNGWVYRVNPNDGTEQSRGLGWASAETLIDSDGDRLLAGCAGSVVLLNPTTLLNYGSWPNQVLVAAVPVPARTNVLCQDGLVYASVGNVVTAFDPQTGAVRWRSTLNTVATIETQLATDGAVVYCAASGGSIYGYDDDTHEQVFHAEMNTPATTPTSLLLVNGLLYAASAGVVNGYDPISGTVVLSQNVSGLYDPAGPAAIQYMRLATDGELLLVGANLLVVTLALGNPAGPQAPAARRTVRRRR